MASHDFFRTKLVRPLENAKIKSETIAAQKAPYTYTPLPTQRSFRLLKLPLLQGNPITLVTAPIDSAPAYATLSYTWTSPTIGIDESLFAGTPIPQAILTPSGSKGWLFISRNLYDALNAVTRARHAKYLWADALCVNQADNTEKATQIPLMGEIYSRCERVIVWLGNDKTHVDAMLSIHRNIAAAIIKTNSLSKARDMFEANPSPDFLEQELDVKVSEKKWKAYAEFYENRRWFSRLWVIQEVALAPEVKVLCGWRTSLSWRHLATVGAFVADTVGSQMGTVANPRRVFKQLVLGHEARLLDLLRDECTVGHWKRGVREAQLREMTGARNEREMRFAWLGYLLGQARLFDATRAQDKVYGVLGMFGKVTEGELDELLVPKIEAEAEEVFGNVAWLLVRELPTLAVLSAVGDSSRRRMVGLPSWVPDYSARVPDDSLLAALGGFGRKPNASLAGSNVHHRVLRGSRLELEGVKFGCVGAVACPWEDLFGEGVKLDVLNTMLGLFIEAQLRLSTTRGPGPPGGDETVYDLVYNTLAGGHDGSTAKTKTGLHDFLLYFLLGAKLRGCDGEPAYLECMKHLDALEQRRRQQFPGNTDDRFPTNGDIDRCFAEISETDPITAGRSVDSTKWMKSLRTRIYDFKLRADHITASRRLFSSTAGYVGVGAKSLCPGDQVWLLKGASVLFVLREAEKMKDADGSTEPREYGLVGEAYIHGFMHGEILGMADGGERVERVLLV
ncbi:hypothetical protein OQA88_8755 [Cercophora sp. LCS_1]